MILLIRNSCWAKLVFALAGLSVLVQLLFSEDAGTFWPWIVHWLPGVKRGVYLLFASGTSHT